MIHDKKVIGVCGETSLSNSKQSIITMMQVCQTSERFIIPQTADPHAM